MTERMKQIVKLFSFENRIKDDLATVVSYTDGFLWRRDLTRIVACRLDEKKRGHCDYVIGDLFSKQQVKKIETDEDGKLKVTFSSEEQFFRPEQKTRPDSLRYTLRKDQTFLEEHNLSVKELKNILLVCEQKWLMEKEDDPKIIFDFKNGCIRMPGREEVFALPFSEKKKSRQTEVIYTFHLLKDMVYNKQKEDIFFRISESYTVFEYGEDIYGILMHAHL